MSRQRKAVVAASVIVRDVHVGVLVVHFVRRDLTRDSSTFYFEPRPGDR